MSGLPPRARLASFALEIVAEHFRIEVRDLLSPRGTEPLRGMRQIAMLVAYRASGASHCHIARIFGGRERSTVTTALGHARDNYAACQWHRDTVDLLIQQTHKKAGTGDCGGLDETEIEAHNRGL